MFWLLRTKIYCIVLWLLLQTSLTNMHCFMITLAYITKKDLQHCFMITLANITKKDLQHCFMITLAYITNEDLLHCFMITLAYITNEDFLHCFLITLAWITNLNGDKIKISWFFLMKSDLITCMIIAPKFIRTIFKLRHAMMWAHSKTLWCNVIGCVSTRPAAIWDLYRS